MQTAAEKANQLDPLSGEAHIALAVSRARVGQWAQAEQNFRRGLEIDPNSSMSHAYFAMYQLLPLGRIDGALRELQIADKADPLSPQIQGLLAYVLISARRYDEAAEHCRKSSNDNGCLGRVSLGQGKLDIAIQHLRSSAASLDRAFLGHVLGRTGHREEAETLAIALRPHAYQEALVFAGLGDKDRTFEALNRAAVLGPIRMGRQLTFPEFDLIRGDPRVKGLRKSAGLPE